MRYRFHQVKVAGQAAKSALNLGVDPRNSADAMATQYRWKITQATQRRWARMAKFVGKMEWEG